MFILLFMLCLFDVQLNLTKPNVMHNPVHHTILTAAVAKLVVMVVMDYQVLLEPLAEMG